MVKITDVEKGSYAEECEILPGDILVSVNGNEINDVLDYRFYLTESECELLLTRGGEEYGVVIEKDEYEDIGLGFETPLMDEKHACKNGCIFCFIDQNPKGLRESLYFKDDDSRLSFIHGNYVTLTNMTDSDIARIIKMRISPVNISVHTTNPELRVKMMKNKRSGEVLRYLDDFKRAGLSMCGQIVLCRGVNDGEELTRTLTDLSRYFPEMGSVSVVPAGLTAHREGLYPLSDFTPEEASAIIDEVDRIGESQLRKYGSRQFFAADELYLKAGRQLPESEYYEDYPQIENGVGMLRSFLDEFGMALEDVKDVCGKITSPRRVTVATGEASYESFKRMAASLEAICPHLRVSVKKIVNNFFGRSVTVSGLLTGKDISEQLAGEELGEELFISANCLRHGEDVFLCGMTVEELSRKLGGVRICATDSDGYAFACAVLGVSV